MHIAYFIGLNPVTLNVRTPPKNFKDIHTTGASPKKALMGLLDLAKAEERMMLNAHSNARSRRLNVESLLKKPEEKR